MSEWPDHERLLEQVRQWLAQTQAESEAAGPAEMPDGQIALRDVVEAFTALRHELKLQTRTARVSQEQSESLLAALRESLGRFDSVRADEDAAGRRASEPYAQSLAEVDEALERGIQALEQGRRSVVEQSFPALRQDLEELHRAQPWWRKWLTEPFLRTVEKAWFPRAVASQRETWDSLRDGYRLIQNRLRRAMSGHGLQRIPTAGLPVDPRCMTVRDIVRDATRPSGTVADELRPGYLWQGRVLKPAEVRAVVGIESELEVLSSPEC